VTADPKKKTGSGRKLIAALAAAAAVLSLVVFLLFQRVRAPDESWPSFRFTGAAEGDGRVILLLADRLTYGDLRRRAGPNLARLLEQGAVALMNVRAGRTGSESGYLSLGAGARAAAGPEGREAFERGELFEGEQAEVIFERRTGKPPKGALFHLQAAALQVRNSALPYPVTVGLMGEMLQKKGLSAAVWGNADGAAPNRSAVLAAMDYGGEVPAGAIGRDLLRKDPLYPFGVRTDVDRLASAVVENLSLAHLHVVEFGDSSRLDEYWPQLAPARGEALFRTTMENLDRLLGRLLPLVDGEGAALLLLAPSLPLNRPAGGEQLAPFIFTAAGQEPGLLLSAATRRPGLVQNTDLVSLIFSLLEGGGRSASPGPVSSFGIIPHEEALAFLDRFSSHTSLVSSQRSPLLKGYVAALVAALLAALAGLLLKIGPLLPPLSRVIRLLIFVPPALLLLPGLTGFPRAAAWQSAFVLLGAALLPALLMHSLLHRCRHLYWAVLGWAIAFLLLIDTLAGASLQQLSIFSYDPVGGARYYGMGNEYMGVLIGAALLGTVSLAAYVSGESAAPRQKIVSTLLNVAIIGFYVLIIFILAAPNFGANLGGTLAAAVAFGMAWAELSGMGEQKKKRALCVIAFLLLAAGLLYVLNVCLPQLPPSHVGLFGEMVASRGPAGFWETAGRKMSMNLKLVRYSIWGRALVTLVGLCVVLSLYPGGLRQRLQREHPDLAAGITAALAGAAAALLTNDSGVVAAATILLYVVPPVLLTVMQKSYTPGQDRGIRNERQD
jgi:hypothetical protein